MDAAALLQAIDELGVGEPCRSAIEERIRRSARRAPSVDAAAVQGGKAQSALTGGAFGAALEELRDSDPEPAMLKAVLPPILERLERNRREVKRTQGDLADVKREFVQAGQLDQVTAAAAVGAHHVGQAGKASTFLGNAEKAIDELRRLRDRESALWDYARSLLESDDELARDLRMSVSHYGFEASEA